MTNPNEERIRTLRETWNAPAKHVTQHAQLSDKHKAWSEVLAENIARRGTGYLRALIGGRGSGKTQIGVELMIHATANMKSARYTTAMDFFLRLRRSYNQKDCETEWDIVSAMKRCSLLVIDEIGKRGQSDWENNILFEIINSRYNSGVKDTLVIDNATPEEFQRQFGDSLVSRMKEQGGITVCAWPSFR
jgi:DNA replication protein DnaC